MMFPCSAGEKRFECPMCSVACSDTSSLQEHVELHLDSGAGGNVILPCCNIIQQSLSLVLVNTVFLLFYESVWWDAAGSPGSDLELARKLQQELELRRREEEARREREEFKKLQVWTLQRRKLCDSPWGVADTDRFHMKKLGKWSSETFNINLMFSFITVLLPSYNICKDLQMWMWNKSVLILRIIIMVINTSPVSQRSSDPSFKHSEE